MNDGDVTRSPASETAIRLHELTGLITAAKSAPMLGKAAAAQRALDTAQLVLWSLHDRLRVLESRLKE